MRQSDAAGSCSKQAVGETRADIETAFGRGSVLVAGACPGNDLQPLERNLAAVVAETELFRRPVESLQRCVDLIQLTRRTCRVRFVELLIHGIGADVGRMERHQRQIACFFLLGAGRTIGEDAIQ